MQAIYTCTFSDMHGIFGVWYRLNDYAAYFIFMNTCGSSEYAWGFDKVCGM